MCRIEGWSVRTLRERIDSMLYERTALSKQPDALIRQGLAILRSKGDVTLALVVKDPYVLDFLGLTDRSISFHLPLLPCLCSTHAVALSPFHSC
jgi:predicted nuclease of restriction endonuclease-like (RecB) superfamily